MTARDNMNEAVDRLIERAAEIDAVKTKRLIVETTGAEIYPKSSIEWLTLVELHDRLEGLVLTLGPRETNKMRRERREARRQRFEGVIAHEIQRWRLRDDPTASEITSGLMAGDVTEALLRAGLL